ncbi:MAG: hypothetical protein AAF961_03175 [Planctomycetota bacterium]
MNAPSDQSAGGPLGLPAFVWRLIFAAALLLIVMMQSARASDACCSAPPPPELVVSQPQTESWIFRHSRYTHDPETGARVAQYDRLPAIEPLDDPRLYTSGYSRSRTVLRGADGSADTYYRVRSYGNGRGGLDAEWERFHDAWRGSTIAGGAFNAFYPPIYGGFGPYAAPYGGGYGDPGYGDGRGGHHGRGHRGRDAYGYGYGYGAPPGYAPAYGAPFQGPIDPDGADGFSRPREPFPIQPWERRRFERKRPPTHPPDDGSGGAHRNPPGDRRDAAV